MDFEEKELLKQILEELKKANSKLEYIELNTGYISGLDCDSSGIIKKLDKISTDTANIVQLILEEYN
jgi:hypothetical protein